MWGAEVLDSAEYERANLRELINVNKIDKMIEEIGEMR